MKQVFRELYSRNEVVGVCVSDENTIVFDMLKDNGATVDFSSIVPSFIPLKNWALREDEAAKSITAVYKSTVLILKCIDGNRWLHVVCGPGTRPDMLFPDIDRASNQLVSGSEKAETFSVREQYPQECEAIQNALIKVTGPMGDILFRDAENRLTETPEDEGGVLQALIGHINEELDDPELIAAFEELVEPFLATA